MPQAHARSRTFRSEQAVPVLFRFAACDKNRQLNKGGTAVDLALRRLDVLAVCAVFVFVGAVLLGAF